MKIPFEIKPPLHKVGVNQDFSGKDDVNFQRQISVRDLYLRSVAILSLVVSCKYMYDKQQISRAIKVGTNE